MTLTADEFKTIFQFMKDAMPTTSESALINRLNRMEIKLMTAVEIINAKLTETTNAVVAEAIQVKAIIDELAVTSASERISPEQLTTLSARFDGVITAIQGIAPDAPVVT